MIYDSLTMAACVKEMKAVAINSIVHQVRQPRDLDIVIVCRSEGRQIRILLSADSRWARAHLATQGESVPKTPPSFCQLLRKHLEGARITQIQQSGLDRVLQILFSRPGGATVTLIHEIMGRHSNIILVSKDDTVLGAAKIVGSKLSRVRQIIPGQPYNSPPNDRFNPLEMTEQSFAELWNAQFADTSPSAQTAAKWLVSSFTGVSPILAEELTARAGQIDPASLWGAFTAILEDTKAGKFNPIILRLSGRSFETVYPFELISLPANSQFVRPTISEALESTVRAEIAGASLEQSKTEWIRRIEKRQEGITRETDELLLVLNNPSLPDELRQKGEILLGHYSQVMPGCEHVELPNYYDPEMKPLLITLRADLSIQDNVNRYFKQARKAADRFSFAQARLPALEEQAYKLNETAERIRNASNIQEIQQIIRQVGLESLSDTVQTQTKPEDKPFGGYRIKSATSDDGFEILIGESAEANDYLTTKLARPDDIWMHARAVNGAHVIIRTSGAKNIPQSTLKKAAKMAAGASDARNSSYIPVDWTLRKHVRKPRKSAPGFVTYTHEKTIHITPEDK